MNDIPWNWCLGTAIANLLADNTKKIIYLWSLKKAETINSTSINKKYLPSKKINKNILASSYLPNSINIIFIVIPSQFIYDF